MTSDKASSQNKSAQAASARDLRHRERFISGVRASVAWLHTRARGMADPNARSILDSAATNLGWDLAANHVAEAETASSVHSGPLGVALYLPISDLKDGTIGPVVFWNDCNGPYYERLVLSGEARDWREDGVFTHFVLLENDPREREARSSKTEEAR